MSISVDISTKRVKRCADILGFSDF